MRILEVCQPLVLFVLLFIAISSADRTKRQIIFEDDNTNRLFNSDCRTPDRRPGRCIRLTNCRALTQSISRNRLRRYICGFEGNEPKVCCPMSREEVAATIPTIRTTLRTTPTTVPPTRRPPSTPPTRRPPNTPPTRRPTVRTTPPIDEEWAERNAGGGRVTPRPEPDALTRPPFLPASCGHSRHTQTRVVGGSPAENGSWPWMAVVFVRRSNGALVADCGGALVTNQHVVTAAHCVVTGRRSVPLDPSRVVVRLGAHNLSIPNEPGSIDIEVESIQRHEQFESRTYRNDIAVLKLRTPIPFTNKIQPVCLPYDSLRGEDLANKGVFVIGYGTTAFNGNSSDVLMQAGFYIQSQEVCRRAYEPEVQITRVYLCAGMMDGSKDACQGDSGGPLLTVGRNNSYYLIGVVSFGRQCGQPNYPGVYTRVTEFLDWLARNLSN